MNDLKPSAAMDHSTWKEMTGGNWSDSNNDSDAVGWIRMFLVGSHRLTWTKGHQTSLFVFVIVLFLYKYGILQHSDFILFRMRCCWGAPEYFRLGVIARQRDSSFQQCRYYAKSLDRACRVVMLCKEQETCDVFLWMQTSLLSQSRTVGSSMI